jgi:hypothetical protein
MSLTTFSKAILLFHNRKAIKKSVLFVNVGPYLTVLFYLKCHRNIWPVIAVRYSISILNLAPVVGFR